MTHRRGHGDNDDGGRGGDPAPDGSARNAAIALSEGSPSPTLPDYPHILRDDPNSTRLGSGRINNIAPPSPREFYIGSVGLDDTVPPAYGECWVRGKNWIVEQDQANGNAIFIPWVFAEVEIDTPQTFRIGDQEAAIGGSGNVRTVLGGTLYLGDPTQNLASVFNAHVTGTYTDTHPGMVIFWDSFLPVDLTGAPVVECKAKWKNDLYDPRRFYAVAANGSATTSDYFEAADHANFRPGAGVGLSVECWFRLDSGATMASARSAVAKWAGTDGFSLEPVHVGFTDQPAATIAINTTTPVVKVLGAPAGTVPDDNEPHHLAFTYDPTTQNLKLFLDGCVVAEETYAEPNGDVVNNATPTLKVNYSGVDYAVTDVRIWLDVRTPAEVRGSYKSLLLGTETGLVLYYPMDDGQGTTVLTDRATAAPAHNATKVGTNVTIDTASHVVGRAPVGVSWEPRAYSANPALICGDVVELATQGNVSSNWNDVADVADHCDTVIGGGKRGDFNSALDGEQDWTDWLDYISEHGFLVWWRAGDEVRYREDWTATTADTLNEDDIVPGSLSWVNGDPGYEETPDLVAIRYMNGDEEDTAYNVTPTGSERFIDFRKMLGFNNHGHARRYAKKVQSGYVNEPYLVQCDVVDKAVEWEKWDVIEITIEGKLGLVDVPFRLMQAPKIVGPGVRRCNFKLYSATTYSTSDDAAPTINLSTIPSVKAIPTGPAVDLVEVFDFVAPDRLRARVRFDEPDFVHTKAIVLQVFNQAETAMLVLPIVLIIGTLTEIAAGPPRTLEAIIEVPLEFQFKVRAAIMNTLDELGAFSAYAPRTFASGFEDPEVIPTNIGTITVGTPAADSDGSWHPFLEVAWDDFEATLNYPYLIDSVLLLETDGDGTASTYRELERVTVPARVLVKRFNMIRHYRFPPDADTAKRQKFRITRIDRNLFGNTKTTIATPQVQSLPPDFTFQTLVISRVEFDADDDQKALVFVAFKQQAINYFGIWAMVIQDLQTLQSRTYYDSSTNAAVGDNDVIKISPLIIDHSPIDPTAPYTHDAVNNTVPKTQNFIIGRSYKITVFPVNISGNSMASANITVEWGASVYGGLDSSID